MDYIESCTLQAEVLRKAGKATILAIESSCDETAAAVVADGRRVLSNVIASQIETHALYGGVVPEIASRQHIEAVDLVIEQALLEAGVTLPMVDAIAVTNGPGLVGALLVGVSCAKALAYAAGKPLIPVNHIEGHICANYIASEDCAPPFICLVASGGHSHILSVRDYGDYTLLGQTQDDAAGEAFDKAARVLGLAYPGGPLLDALAETGNAAFLTLPRARLEGRYDLSFSGVKTSLVNRVHQLEQLGQPIPKADFAAAFRQAVVGALVEKTMLAVTDTGAKAVAVAGGVAANRLLRGNMETEARKRGIRLFIPPISLCTDNAAMIGGAAFFQLMAGNVANLRLNAVPSLSFLPNK